MGPKNMSNMVHKPLDTTPSHVKCVTPDGSAVILVVDLNPTQVKVTEPQKMIG